MYLHEYQAKNLLKAHGVNVAPFTVAATLDEVQAAIDKGLTDAVVKVQVHAGGRGKAGGVKLARSPD